MADAPLALRLRRLVGIFERLLRAVLTDAQEALLQVAIGFEARGLHDPVDPAVDHDRHFFGDRGGDPDILLDDKDADVAFRTEIEQNFLDSLDDHRGQAFGRLIHDEQTRVEQERPRNGEHLLLAAGKLVTAIRAPFRQPRECLVDAREWSSSPDCRRMRAANARRP